MEISNYSPSNLKVQTLNVPEIFAFADLIQRCTTLPDLSRLYHNNEFEDPYTYYAFGVSFSRLDNSYKAKESFIQGARYGLKPDIETYNHLFVGRIGQCFARLVINFNMEDHEQAFRCTELGYLYMSKCLELTNNKAIDIYPLRALLLSRNENPLISESVISENFSSGALKEPFIISDYYFGYHSPNSPFNSFLNKAKEIHDWLEDISIAGKDANEYSLKEIAELGQERHYVLFKTLEGKYIKRSTADQEATSSFKHHSTHFHHGHSKIIDFFKSNPFGSNNPVMTFLSVLSPLDRCVILEELYNPNILDSILSDKLLLAYVTSGKINHAKEVIQNSIRNGESEINIWGLNTKLEVGLAPKRNASERIAIFNNYLNKTQNPTEIDFLNILIDFCSKYDKG